MGRIRRSNILGVVTGLGMLLAIPLAAQLPIGSQVMSVPEDDEVQMVPRSDLMAPAAAGARTQIQGKTAVLPSVQQRVLTPGTDAPPAVPDAPKPAPQQPPRRLPQR